MKIYNFIFSLFIISFLLIGCTEPIIHKNKKVAIKKNHDLLSIVKRGKLIAVTQNNSIDYFVYRGEPMGYQIELLQNFTNYLGIKLEIIVSNNIDKMFTKLNDNECDIIAVNLTKTLDRAKIINFTKPLLQTRQVLIQRKPKKWMSLSRKKLESSLIRNTIDLGGKTIYVQKNSSHKQRLDNLSEEIGEKINVVELDSVDVEEIISKVADSEIDYAICDENVGKVNKKYYQNIDVSTPISFPQSLSWGVRKNSPELLKQINNWVDSIKPSKSYIHLYNKYFRNKNSAYIQKSDYYSNITGTISLYDKLIKKESAKIGWDWRLVSSLIYQESKFKTNLTSWAGASGIMQIMPSTAEYLGLDSTSTPEQNIIAGIRYLKWLEKYFVEVKDTTELHKFVIASYNVGAGHVLDAQRLAEKYGKNKNIWDNNVDEFILKKSQPKFYRDPVVKNGYCRGREPYDYVKNIFERYEHYKNVVKD